MKTAESQYFTSCKLVINKRVRSDCSNGVPYATEDDLISLQTQRENKLKTKQQNSNVYNPKL